MESRELTVIDTSFFFSKSRNVFKESKKINCALAIILEMGGLAVLNIGICGLLQNVPFSSLGRMPSLIMVVLGGSVSTIIGIGVGTKSSIGKEEHSFTAIDVVGGDQSLEENTIPEQSLSMEEDGGVRAEQIAREEHQKEEKVIKIQALWRGRIERRKIELRKQHEIDLRNLKKSNIEKAVKEHREIFLKYYEQFKKDVLEDPDYPLLSTFISFWSLSKDFQDFHANRFLRWEDRYVSLVNKSFSSSKLCVNFFKEETLHIISSFESWNDLFNLMDHPLNKAYYLEMKHLTYNFLSEIKNEGIDPGIIWENFDLKEEYETMFPNKATFWSSKYSLKEIYKQLCEYKKHHTV